MKIAKKLLVGIMLSALFSVILVAGEINVLAAASLKFVLEDIKKEFSKTHKKDKISISYISSGKAYAQIKNGSPTHLFISADTSYPQKVFDDKLSESKPQNYAQGKLVLISANENFNATNLQVLLDDKITHIAIPDSKVAPYGRAAQEFLKSQKLDKKLKNKLVTGDSIGSATSFVLQGASEIGFSALSMVIKDKTTKNLTYSIIDSSTYKPILQAFIITNYGKDSTLTKEFAEFLLQDKAQAIFKEYGYDKAQ